MCLELTEKDVDGRSRACCLAIASMQQFLVPGCNGLETNLLKLVSLVNCSRKLKPSMLIPNWLCKHASLVTDECVSNPSHPGCSTQPGYLEPVLTGIGGNILSMWQIMYWNNMCILMTVIFVTSLPREKEKKRLFYESRNFCSAIRLSIVWKRKRMKIDKRIPSSRARVKNCPQRGRRPVRWHAVWHRRQAAHRQQWFAWASSSTFLGRGKQSGCCKSDTHTWG